MNAFKIAQAWRRLDAMLWSREHISRRHRICEKAVGKTRPGGAIFGGDDEGYLLVQAAIREYARRIECARDRLAKRLQGTEVK